MEIKYILFDVADTLIYKKNLLPSIHSILLNNNINVSINELKYVHRNLFDKYLFPDKTNKDFYIDFNSKLLNNLSISPNNKLLNEIYTTCSELEWTKYEDSNILKKIHIPYGVASNFSADLRPILTNLFGEIFHNIFISEEIGFKKPNPQFYKHIINKLNIHPKNLLMIGDSVNLDGKPSILEGINFLLIDRNNYYLDYKPKIKSLFQLKDYIKTYEK